MVSISAKEIIKLSPQKAVDFLKEIDHQVSIEEFMAKELNDPSFSAFFSYWEKWLPVRYQKIIDKIITENREENGFFSNSLPLALDKYFSKPELDILFSNTGAIQLTFGCSGGCQFCGLDAPEGIREHIPFFQLSNLFHKFNFSLKKSDPFLYWASEPHDYSYRKWLRKKTYKDVHNLASRQLGYQPHITTRISFDKQWFDFVSKRGKRSRLSVFGSSLEKIKELKKKTTIELYGKNRNHYQGLGMSFQKDIPHKKRPLVGIGCFNGVLLTPRGIYNIIQVPVSSKYPQGQVVMPVTAVNGKEIKIGDKLDDVLGRSVVRYCKLIRKIERMAVPFLTICQDSSNYDIAVDKNLIIQAILPSVRPEIDKKIENIIKAVEKLRNKKNRPNKEEADKLKKQIQQEESAIISLFLKRVEELHKFHTLNNCFYDLEMMIGNEVIFPSILFSAKKSGNLVSFSKEDTDTLFTVCYSSLCKPIKIPVYFQSCPIPDGKNIWKDGQNITTEELHKLYGNSLKIKLKFNLKTEDRQ